MAVSSAAVRRVVLAALGLGLAAQTVCAAPKVESKAIEVGRVLPDVNMIGLNGPARRLSSYVGRPLIINVWASWCGPCRAEAASLERFTWSDAGQKFTVIGISTDDDRLAAEKWLKQSNATLSHFIDRALVLENMLGASSIPLTVLVDARGRVVARFQGARAWDSLESAKLLNKALAEAGANVPQR